MKYAELKELEDWQSSFSPFGLVDKTIKPIDVARRLERAENERDALLLKVAQLTGQQPEGSAYLFATVARNRRLESRDGWSVWREVKCECCGKSMLYDNGDERDLTCMDVEAVKCWNCGAVKFFDDESEALEELAETTYPPPNQK